MPQCFHCRVSILAELGKFIEDQRPHGTVTADATEPAWNGHLNARI
jgi:hypothetical protein